MAMKTLAEIDKAEEAKRERARLYEVALDTQYRAKKMVERLETLDAQAAVKALTSVQELLVDVPADLTTRGTRFIAGGFLVRELLTSIVGNALADVSAKSEAAKKALAKARKDLAAADAAVKEFTN